jgi:hypothetical protein
MQNFSFQTLKTQIGPRPHQHPPSSLRGASWRELINNADSIIFIGNERRGNLPSLTYWREFFKGCKTSLQRSQSREIASGMRQRFALFTFSEPSTETRNDEVWCERRELQISLRSDVCGY